MKKIITFVFLTLICWLFIAAGIQLTLRGQNTLSWVIIKGQIIENNIQKDAEKPGSNSNWSQTYRVHLKYCYCIKTKRYNNNVITYKGMNATYDGALMLSQKYAINKIIDVYYNPEKPQESVLELGRDNGSVMFIIGPFVIWILFTFGLILAKDKMK